MLSEIEESLKQELSRLQKHFQCPICLNLMSDPMVTHCVHHFCGQCITKAIQSSSGDYCRCPLCNEKITKRALRSQLDINDMVNTLKAAIDSFENDNQMSLITDNNDVVVFDVSSDRSKSCVKSTDSFGDLSETNESKDKILNKTNDSVFESSESNGKTTTIVRSEEWPSCGQQSNESLDDIIEDMNKTDVYFETSKSSQNESFESLRKEFKSVVEPLPTQSQNLKVTKSRITYGSTRPSTDDKFDRIIRLSEINSNLNQNKSKQRDHKNEPQMDVRSLQSKPKTLHRKPLTQINRNKTKNLNEKKKFRRIEAFDSSDDEISIIDTKSKDNKEVYPSMDDNSEDLFLPAIHNKNKGIDSNRKNSLTAEELNSDGYNSGVELITSSPVSEF